MNTKCLTLAFAVVASTLPVFGQNDQIRVRMINALPTSPALSVAVGEKNLFSDVSSNDITKYIPMPQQDEKTVHIKMADGRTLKTEDELSFDDNASNYTVLVTPDESGSNPKVAVLKQDMEDVDSNEVEVTLVNASPQHKSVKLSLNDDIKESGVNYAELDDDTVDPGVYTLKLIDATGTNSIIATRSVTLTGGSAVTVLLTGQNTVKVVNDASPENDVNGAHNGMMGRDHTTTGSMNNMMTTGTMNHMNGTAGHMNGSMNHMNAPLHTSGTNALSPVAPSNPSM